MGVEIVKEGIVHCVTMKGNSLTYYVVSFDIFGFWPLDFSFEGENFSFG